MISSRFKSHTPMRSSMDYTSPNQDHSSNSKLSPPPIIGETTTTTRDHHHHQQSTNTNCTTTTTITQTLGPNYPNPAPITAVASAGPVTRYRECLKNHAASSGGHVLDGCGEFMPASADGDSLKCAACDCHRNFHRKETKPHHPNPNYSSVTTPRQNQLTTTPLPRGNSTVLLPRQQHYSHFHDYHHHQRHHHPVMMAFGGAESSSEDLVNAFDPHRDQSANINNDYNNNNNNNNSKKRFRTKFKEGQKERMTEFAERLRWRIQKHDEQEVQRFCSEIGVKRQVFKVWMHNNKQAMKKKDNSSNSSDHRLPNVSVPIT